MGNKKELTKLKIVSAAVRLISSHGFNVTTIASLKRYSPHLFFKAIVSKRLDFIEKNIKFIKVARPELQFNDTFQTLANKKSMKSGVIYCV